MECEPSDSIASIKEKLAAMDSAAPADKSKLIFQGRVLTDAILLSSLCIKEHDFMVLMKPKPAVVAAAVAAAAATHVPPPVDAPAPAAPLPAPAPPGPAPATGDAVNSITLDDSVIDSLCDMGFPRAQVLAALAAAFGNAERAVQYLFEPSTMPNSSLALPAQVTPAPLAATPPALAPPAPAATPAAPPASSGPFTAESILAALGGGAPPQMSPLEQMMSEPQLLQLITLARQNPSSLGPLLQELSTAAPHLVQMVSNNQQSFQQLLTMESLPTPPATGQGRAASTPGIAASEAGGGGGGVGGTVHIQLTREEADAIGRLQQLGFSRDQAAQAFLACEKNETLAANLLFEGGL